VNVASVSVTVGGTGDAVRMGEAKPELARFMLASSVGDWLPSFVSALTVEVAVPSSDML